jgi:MoxR-like ATPase
VTSMNTPSNKLRDLVTSVITTVESRGLFVHSTDLEIKYVESGGKKDNVKTTRIPLIVGACVLNALVPRSAMLLIGGHGGGKTTLAKILGRMMTGKSLEEIDTCILRGHPQLTEEKMVATLKPGPLIKDGVEIVVWRSFITGFWKIIDEVNRLTPHSQNILLSLLAEGEVKYYDETKRCDEYCLFATLNPADAGTFDIGAPFLDRFGMAVPITMPTVSDLELILASRDERLFGFDELWQVPAILTEESLLTIWNLADKIPVSLEASEYMRSLVREFGACIRVDKSQSSGLTVETGLCDGCHFNTAKSVCNKVIIPLSVRAAKDLNRYSKAVAWLVGAHEVSIEIVKSLAPLIFWHRTRFVHDELDRSPYYGDVYAFTQHLVELASARYAQRAAAVDIIDRLKHGNESKDSIEQLKEMAKSDLLVQLDYTGLAKELKKSKYVTTVQNIERGIKGRDVDQLTIIHDDLLHNTDFPNRSMLLKQVSEALHRLTLTQFELSFEQWQEIWTIIGVRYPKLTPVLKETLSPPKRKVLRVDGLTLVVYVTGDSPESAVFLEISGGSEAMKLKDELESHMKS